MVGEQDNQFGQKAMNQPKRPAWKRRRHYSMTQFKEYEALKQYTFLMYSMGIIERERPGEAFKVLSEIVLTTDGLITEGMLNEYKNRKLKKK